MGSIMVQAWNLVVSSHILVMVELIGEANLE